MEDLKINPVHKMGATFHVGSDKWPYTVVGILNNNKIYATNDLDETVWHLYDNIFTYRKDGKWRPIGAKLNSNSYLTLGEKITHGDPNF